jgi:hypothetical protein
MLAVLTLLAVFVATRWRSLVSLYTRHALVVVALHVSVLSNT